MSKKLKLTKSEKIFAEAKELSPGGVMGIRRPYNFVPGEYPIFFQSAKGGKVTDVDGNEYIDMLCAYGPIIIGHREKEIDQAAINQIKEVGFCMSLAQPIQNTLIKKLQRLIPSCEKAVIVKTGSDATTTAIRVARAYTDRTKILRCGYHGWHDWCVEVKGGVPSKVYEDTFEFEYNNLDSLTQLMSQHGPQVAAIIVTPVGHPLAHEVQMPANNFLQEVQKIAQHYGSVLIFDEIRSGFRVNIGGAQKEFGVTPDLSVFGKAMGNGYPISAVVGKAQVMNVLEQKAFLSSTFFPNSVEQAAAIKTIDFLQKNKVLEIIKKRGNQWGKNIQKIIDHSGIPATFSGGPWMPYITFTKDENGLYKKLRNAFYTELIRRKVFLQPYHHGYICFRHSDKDLAYASGAIEESFKEIKKVLP